MNERCMDRNVLEASTLLHLIYEGHAAGSDTHSDMVLLMAYLTNGFVWVSHWHIRQILNR